MGEEKKEEKEEREKRIEKKEEGFFKMKKNSHVFY